MLPSWVPPFGKCNPIWNPCGQLTWGHYGTRGQSYMGPFFSPFQTHMGPTNKCWLGSEHVLNNRHHCWINLVWHNSPLFQCTGYNGQQRSECKLHCQHPVTAYSLSNQSFLCLYTVQWCIIQELNIDVLHCGPGEHCNETYIVWTAFFYNLFGLNIGCNDFSR